MTDDRTHGPDSYREAGVDIEEGARAVERIAADVRSTYRPEVIGDIGGFGGMFSAKFAGMTDPVLVSGADGVGTKLKLAQMLDRHDSVGVDLVAMCANDVLVSGAEPLFFLDYIAIGKVTADKIGDIVSGIAEGCRLAGCALLGGETAEHPGVMAEDDYDLSGFCVGVVDRPRIIDGSGIKPGDVVLGLASTGVHSNGFSLVRKLLIEGHEASLQLPRTDLGGEALGDRLLAPTRIYAKSILKLLAEVPVKGMAHITGGGITENLNRVLPADVDARVIRGSWKMQRVFELLQQAGELSDDEMYRTFNMGIGFCVICDPHDAPKAAIALRAAGETVVEIGEIVPGEGMVVYA